MFLCFTTCLCWSATPPAATLSPISLFVSVTAINKESRYAAGRSMPTAQCVLRQTNFNCHLLIANTTKATIIYSCHISYIKDIWKGKKELLNEEQPQRTCSVQCATCNVGEN